MSMLQLLSGYDKLGITFEVVDNRLKINAPKGTLNPDLIDEIKRKKEELLAFLRKYVYKRRDYVSIEPTEKMEYYALSPAQKRLYIVQRMETRNVSYNMPVVLPLPDDFDKQKMETAFRRLIRRHESLRTSFFTVQDEPVQRIHDEVNFEIENRDAVEDFVRPFDLSRAPLMRVGLITSPRGKSLLVLDMHHIITDGTSQNILKHEFMRLYNAVGDDDGLPPLRLQYRDYSQWLNSPEQREAVKRQETYWTGVMSDEPPVLTLPTDFPRPEIQSYEGGRVHFSLSPGETSALKGISETANVTLYMTLLSMFNILLSRLSGLEDIIVGTPIAARRHQDLEPIIGMFVNTLVLRNYPSGSKPFSTFLNEVREQTLNAYENQEYPFEELVDKVLVRRDTGRNPLFDVMFNLLNQSEYPEDIPDGDEEDREETTYAHKNRTSKFDMNMTAVEVGGGTNERLFFDVEYCTRLFKESTVLRFVDYFKKIVSRVLENIDIELCRVEILTEAEKKRLLVDFNDTEADFPPDRTIHRLFEEQAARTPGNIAVSFQGETVTYEDLNKNADVLAGILMEKGVGPDTVTGLMADRSIELITGILGILKAGGAYLPIDPDYPEERIRYMLEDSGAGVLVSKAAGPRELSGRIEIVDPGKIGAGAAVLPVHPVSHSPGQLCYVIYTSGSTGKPKAVMLEHRNLVNLMMYQSRFTNLDFCSVLQFASIGFDVSFQEIFSALLAGGKLVLIPKETRTDIPALFRVIETNVIRTLFLPMSILKILFNEGEHIRRFPRCVRHIVTAGEQVVVGDRFKHYLKEHNVYLHNQYGPAEAHVVTALTLDPAGDIPALPPIGKPLSNTTIRILDRYGNLVPPGVPGELHIGGVQVGRGYMNSPEVTAKRFFNKSYRSYKTGDLGRHLPDGCIEFLGRIDHQVKIRGFRVELGEIETRLINHSAVTEAVVLTKGRESGERSLCAYIVVNSEIEIADLRQYLSDRLPHFMVPAHFVVLDKLPLTPNGKINRRELLKHNGPGPGSTDGHAAPGTEMENVVAGIWRDVLETDAVGIHDNFFEIGGNSINILKVQSRLKKAVGLDTPVVKLFKYPTIHTCARYLEQEQRGQTGFDTQLEHAREITRGSEILKAGVDTSGLEIAVIGMAGIFPGAKDIHEFWDNLKNGTESISFFSDEELEESGVTAALLKDPNYVKARGVIGGVDCFDAAFFNYTPLEAEIMDPQVRIFHHSVWTALEDAGYDPFAYPGRIGLYAGSSPHLYWEVLSMTSHAGGPIGDMQSFILSDKDFMCSRIAYKLNLKGPGFSVQTACSTSLVAVHLAVRGLLNGECEMALAGGVTVTCPVKSGYLYRQGMIKSADGHCRAFDAESNGMVGGVGAGVVALKRYKDALADGDFIYALIKGSAINNDGIRKVGYTAPSVEGQAEVVLAAQQMAGVHPETVTYIEAHGTGTDLGDPVEVEALKMVFNTGKKNVCGIGSVKTNIGHLDTAAGVAGFIKTVLSLKHRLIPPNLNFKRPNPKLGLENSPFYVVSRLTQWEAPGNGVPRRAGVSSLGIGGTNAHVVLEEAPAAPAAPSGREYRLLLLSARTPRALEKMTANLVDYLNKNIISPINNGLADIAHTLQTGRRHFPFRKMTVCASHDAAGAAEVLSSNSRKVQTALVREEKPRVIFMFPGQGAQYVNMALGVYRDEPVFRRELDRCFEILEPLTGCDIKDILYPLPGVKNRSDKPHGSDKTYSEKINRTEIAQPLLFALEYSLAKLLMEWGITPDAMIGHSIGEYTAACLSGVFSLEDTLELVALRGRLMARMPGGAMASLTLGEEELLPMLPENLSLAAVNAPNRCVVSGTDDAVETFNRDLEARGYESRRLHTSHAFHSAMMDPILGEFKEKVAGVTLNEPRIPFISNVTGKWAPAEEVTDPAYWSRHIRQPVRFSQGIRELLKKENAVFVEVGPGQSLSTLVRRHVVEPGVNAVNAINLVRHPKEPPADDYYLTLRVGELWLSGVEIDWSRFSPGEKRHRVPLPTYPFEGRRYWPDESVVNRLFSRASHAGNAAKVTSAGPLSRGGTGSGAGDIPREFGGPKYEAPRNDLEKNIARIWKELLGIEKIGIHDDFFRLNGDSLTATQVIARLKDVYPVDVSLHDFFVEPTIAHLAETVKKLLVAMVKNLSPGEKEKLNKQEI